MYLLVQRLLYFFFFFNDTATTEIYTLSLHDALPIYFLQPREAQRRPIGMGGGWKHRPYQKIVGAAGVRGLRLPQVVQDRKSTRLNSSHLVISYAVFCLKKKTTKNYNLTVTHTHHTSS